MDSAPDEHDLRHAYETPVASGPGPAVSEVERALLVETLLLVGKDSPTLCTGWDTHHLAAHLVLRESNPVGSVRAALPKLSDDAVDEVVRRTPFERLVEQFRTGPPALSFYRIPGADRRLNAIEHLIHHEDVRRAQPQWTRRELPPWVHEQIWHGLRYGGKVMLRHSPVPVLLARSDTDETLVARKGAPAVVVRGLPVELALFASGRQQVAGVDLDGDPTDVQRLRSA